VTDHVRAHILYYVAVVTVSLGVVTDALLGMADGGGL
jgi:hypothetical protein